MRPAVQQFAAHYTLNMGFEVLRVYSKTKKAIGDDWNNQPSARFEDFGSNDSIGLRSINGIVVSDCDAREAVSMAAAFLTPTGATWGRASAPRSKRAYRCAELQKKIEFKDLCLPDKDERKMLVEVRVNHQDVLPPSTHTTGERYRWSGLLTSPAEIDADACIREHQLLATAAMVARYYNPSGNRHDWGLALGGLLRRLGITEQEADTILEQAGKYADDPYVRDRLDAIRTTYAKSDDEDLTGGPTLAEIIGEDHGEKFVKTLNKIWRHAAAGANDVVMRGGELSQIVDRAQAALLADTSTPIYQRGGQLIRSIQLDRSLAEDGLRRAAGSTVLVPVEQDWLVERMGQTLKWFRANANGDLQRADPKAIYARTLLGRREWLFPVLRAVLNAPTLALDGRIIQEPGTTLTPDCCLNSSRGYFRASPSIPRKTRHFARSRSCTGH